MSFSPASRDLPCLAVANENVLLDAIPVPLHWCYVLPRLTETGGAIIDTISQA